MQEQRRTYDKNQETVTIPLCLHKTLQRHTLGGPFLRGDSLLDFGKFVSHQFVLFVPIRMVLGQYAKRLSFLAFGHEPPRRLFGKDEQDKLDSGRDDLEQECEAVRPAVCDVERTKCHPSCDDGADVPAGVDESRTLGAITRMRDLGDQRSAADTLTVSFS